MSGLRAVLFDMDGTLVDTERAWVEVVEQVAARHGYALVGAGRTAVYGRSVEDTARMLHEPLAVHQDVLAAELGDGFAARLADGAEPRPGALRLLAALRRDRVPTALVSASRARSSTGSRPPCPDTASTRSTGRRTPPAPSPRPTRIWQRRRPWARSRRGAWPSRTR